MGRKQFTPAHRHFGRPKRHWTSVPFFGDIDQVK